MSSNKFSAGNSKMKEMNVVQSREDFGLPFTLTPACCTKYVQVKPSWKIFLEKV
jgi:hypothetical protein